MLHTFEQRLLLPIFIQIAKLLHRLDITPNAVTLSRLFMTIGIAYLLASGYLQMGGILLLCVSAFDGIDGPLARMSGRMTPFGGFLDSMTDRFSDVALYGGLLFYLLAEAGATPTSSISTEIKLLYLCITGITMVGYIRHRSQLADIKIRRGIFGRTENVIFLSVGLIIDQLTWTLWLTSILLSLTVLQRFLDAWWMSEKK